MAVCDGAAALIALPPPDDSQGLPPCPAGFNLAAHVLALAPRLGEKTALQILRPGGAERWSYARLEAAVRGFATRLIGLGCLPGDRILLRLGNEAAFPVAFLGAIAMGAVPVPTSAQLTEEEITRIAGRLAPRLVLWRDPIACPPGWPVLAADEVLAAEGLLPGEYLRGDPERLAYLVLTSGTSGRALIVAHAHRAIWARQMMHQGWEGLQASDRMLHAGAMNWTFTLGTGLLDPWTLGATALVPDPGVTTEQLPLLARRFDATILAGAPGIFRRLLRGGSLPALPRLRHGLAAGEMLAPALRQDWRAATGTDLHEALGMTECSTYLSSSPLRPAPMGMTGFAQPGRRLSLIEGEIALHRSDPGLMLGYWQDPEETEQRLCGEWFLTGDLAERGPEGAWRFLGRSNDLLNAGGYRLSPLEVEAAFALYPGMGDCAAAEFRMDAQTSLLGLAYEATEPLDPAALAAHAGAHLAGYKMPRRYLWCARLPRGANGKLNRRALAALFEQSA